VSIFITISSIDVPDSKAFKAPPPLLLPNPAFCEIMVVKLIHGIHLPYAESPNGLIVPSSPVRAVQF
jgi:hypothetical protein